MYANNLQNSQIYSKFLFNNKEEQPVLASLLEQCRKSEVDWGDKSQIQKVWSARVTESINAIASDNPYLPSMVDGEVVASLDAVGHQDGARGFDCRPRVFDSLSSSWKLCDTGSMISVVKKSPTDKLDSTKILQAVNGSPIKCYGQKEVQLR